MKPHDICVRQSNHSFEWVRASADLQAFSLQRGSEQSVAAVKLSMGFGGYIGSTVRVMGAASSGEILLAGVGPKEDASTAVSEDSIDVLSNLKV